MDRSGRFVASILVITTDSASWPLAQMRQSSPGKPAGARDVLEVAKSIKGVEAWFIVYKVDPNGQTTAASIDPASAASALESIRKLAGRLAIEAGVEIKLGNLVYTVFDKRQIIEEIADDVIAVAKRQRKIKVCVGTKCLCSRIDLGGTVEIFVLIVEEESIEQGDLAIGERLNTAAIEDVLVLDSRVVTAARAAGSASRSYLSFFPSNTYNPSSVIDLEKTPDSASERLVHRPLVYAK